MQGLFLIVFSKADMRQGDIYSLSYAAGEINSKEVQKIPLHPIALKMHKINIIHVLSFS